MTTYLCVEGGGSNALNRQCRQGFEMLLQKAGFVGSMPRVVACGSRNNALDTFKKYLNEGQSSALLVDSEVAVVHETPWAHLASADAGAWKKPAGASDNQCYLMVVCMESWMLADKESLALYFGDGFVGHHISNPDVEAVSKEEVFRKLKAATKSSKRGIYDKGRDSFKIIKELEPEKIASVSPWAKNFFDGLASLVKAK